MEGDLQRRLGRNLLAQRRAKGLSQEAFADLLGLHRTYIGGLERGERNVTLRTVEQLADRLGIEAGRLLSG
ncbi:MAG: helix-turn-helix domain-containing protein [Acidimicrobiales bacterium]